MELIAKPKREYPCIESTVDVECYPNWADGSVTVRLWIDCLEVGDVLDLKYVKQVRDWVNAAASLSSLFKLLGTVPRINAAQVQAGPFGDRVGIVVYYVSFEGDPHG